MYVDVGSFFDNHAKRNPKVEVYIKNVKKKLKLLPFTAERKVLLSDDGICRGSTYDLRRQHSTALLHGRLRKKSSCSRREHEMIDMEDPEIVDIMRKSTIPPSLSLRAPPANIALGGRREKLIGITNVEASERYMNKLQQDRDRNNQALYKCLDNLPIKIKQMTQSESLAYTDLDIARENALYRSRRPDFYNSDTSIKTYNLNRNCRSLPSPKSTKSQSTLYSKFSTKTNTTTRYSQRKPIRKRLLDSIDPKLFGFEYDLDSVETSINVSTYSKTALPYVPKPGFNGHPIKGKTNLKKSAAVPSLSTSEIMPSKYSKVIDSNQQVRFVYSSVALNSKNKVNNPLPPILSEKRFQKESTDIFAISSVQKFNEPIKEQSESDKRLQEKYLKARYQESPGNIPLVPMHSFTSVTPMSRAAHRRRSKSDTSSIKSRNSRCNSVDDDNLKLPISKTVPQTRDNEEDNGTNDSNGGKYESKDGVEVQSLSETALQQSGELSWGKQEDRSCDLTHNSEREDSNLTTQSEQLQQMKILIHYKTSEVDDIKERSEVSDSFAVPAWVSDAETDKEDANVNNFQRKETNNDYNSLQNKDNNGKVKTGYGENSPKCNAQGSQNKSGDICDCNASEKSPHISGEINLTMSVSSVKNEIPDRTESRTEKAETTYDTQETKDNGNDYVHQRKHYTDNTKNNASVKSMENSSEHIKNETGQRIVKNSNDNMNRNADIDNDDEEDEFGGTTFLTASASDKPVYSFQKINPDQIRTNAISKPDIKEKHSVSKIQKYRTNLESTNQNHTYRNNTDLV